MQLIGPDSVQSWLVSGACCFIYLVQYGVNRLSGMVFVASMKRYNVGREVASIPFTINSVAHGLSSPICGLVAQKLGMRSVVIFGAALSAFGVGACYFAEDIAAVTVLWGVVYGIGMACCVSMLPVMISQHFVKKTALASGVAVSGLCLGTLITPPLFQTVLDNYGLSDTFLILSVVIFSCAPIAFLLKKPVLNKKSSLIETGEKQRLVPHKTDLYDDIKSKGVEKRRPLYCEIKDSDVLEEENTTSGNQMFQKNIEWDLKSTDKPCYTSATDADSKRYIEKKIANYDKQNILSPIFGEKAYADPMKVGEKIQNVDTGVDSSTAGILYPENNILFSSQEQNGTEVKKECVTEINSSKKSFPHAENNYGIKGDTYSSNAMPETSLPKRSSKQYETFQGSASVSGHLKLMCDPSFVLFYITMALNSFLTHVLFNIIIDFSIDVGVDLANQKYILMTISLGELVGRLCLGWIPDRGLMTPSLFMAVSFLAQALAYLGLGLSTNFTMLMVVLPLYGIVQSGCPVVMPSVVSDLIEEDKHLFSVSSIGFLAGPLNLSAPFFIEIFREGLGSYKYMFFGMGGISALCGLSWFLTPCFNKKRGILS